MRRILHRIFGSFYVAVPPTMTERILNLILEKEIISWEYSEADDAFSFFTDKKGMLALRTALDPSQEGITVEQRGLPVRLRPFLHRPGLVLGLVAAICVLWLSGSVVWDVRIEGDQKFSEGQIRAALYEVGVSPGVPLSSLDRRRITLNFLSENPQISYFTYNLRGNVVYVTLMESADPLTGEEKNGGANLIATCDGVIDWLDVRRGEPTVSAGSVVRKGDVLVSGVTDAHGGGRLLYAEGAVYARVQDSFTVSVPRQSEKERLVEGKISGISLDFFGKNINIYQRGGNSPMKYGTIYYKDQFLLPGNISLPFSFTRTVEQIRQKENVTLSEKETVAVAVRLANERLARELHDAELVSRELHGSYSDGAYVLVCDYICIKNIAKTAEFGIG